MMEDEVKYWREKSFYYMEKYIELLENITDNKIPDSKEEDVAEKLYTLQECMKILNISKRTFQLRRKELNIQAYGERPKRISESDLRRLKEYDKERSRKVVQTFNVKADN